MFTCPFIRNLNITTLRGRPLKDFLSTLIQDVYFFPRSTYQIFPFSQYLLRLFNINSMYLATDTPKRSGMPKRKTHLMSTIPRIFDAPLTNYDS